MHVLKPHRVDRRCTPEHAHRTRDTQAQQLHSNARTSKRQQHRCAADRPVKRVQHRSLPAILRSPFLPVYSDLTPPLALNYTLYMTPFASLKLQECERPWVSSGLFDTSDNNCNLCVL